jgi:hypothetical protein
MKKIVFVLLVSLTTITVSAQLKNTKWKGLIHADDDINAVFDYRGDTLEVTNAGDGSSIETMTYTVTDTVLTIKKVYGQSSCDNATEGKYKFEIKEDVLYLALLSDTCDNRSSVLNNSKWDKVK